MDVHDQGFRFNTRHSGENAPEENVYDIDSARLSRQLIRMTREIQRIKERQLDDSRRLESAILTIHELCTEVRRHLERCPVTTLRKKNTAGA